MKKQILLFTIFVLALLAGTTTTFGQGGVKYSDPKSLSCTADALHPVAGQPWTYEATANVTGTYHFWATKDPNFIQTVAGATSYNDVTALTTGSGLIYASANYNTPGTTSNVQITWSSATLANTVFQGTPDPTGATPSPTFVAVYFAADDGCSDNFKVWEIDPLNGFTVDVLAIDPDDVAIPPVYDNVPTTCVDEVESATYSGGAMVYDYGDNYLYFEFVAANFSDYWIPTFDITAGLNAVQTVSYEYTYALPSTWDGSETWSPLVSGTTQLTVDPSVTDTKTGVSVFVRVLVDHANYENLAGQTLTMAVDGQNAAGEWDVINDTCVDPGDADQADQASTTIDPRPEVTPVSPATFITGNEQN